MPRQPASARVAAAATCSRARRGAASHWGTWLTDPRLCAAIVDRLTFHGTIIETGTDSYRLNHTRTEALSV